MLVDNFHDLTAFVSRCAEAASREADAQQLELMKESSQVAHFSQAQSGYSFLMSPDYSGQPLGFCRKVWGVVLSVDLRNSSSRANDLGPGPSFVTMHTYMQAMIRLVGKAKGHIIGLRGDGLLASFGNLDFKLDDSQCNDNEDKLAMYYAMGCGNAMRITVKSIINPILSKYKIRGDLQIGVGIECGNFVITKIGIDRAHDVTAYGSCVNKAANISNHPRNQNKVIVGEKMHKVYPIGKGGAVSFEAMQFDKELMHGASFSNAFVSLSGMVPS